MAQNWSHDPNTLWEQMLRRPVHGLSDTQLSDELGYWHNELRQIHAELRKPFSSWLFKCSKWGGLTLAAAGVPVAFAGAIVGLPFAVGGLAAAVYGHLSAERREARDDSLGIRIGLIVGRLQEIEDFRTQRRKEARTSQ